MLPSIVWLMSFILIVSVLLAVNPFPTLSGGEKLKIQLIRELARPHDIIFLDEPSNDMDLTTMTWLKDFIKAL